MTLSDNIASAYNFFLGHGFTPAQSAGIVGNLQQESGVNPESVQSGGPGRGIAQWSAGGRFKPSLITGDPKQDLNNQLNYILQELNTNPSYGLAALKQQTTPGGAAQVFGTQYERYGIAGARVQDAQNIYAAAGNGPIVNNPSSGITATPASSQSVGSIKLFGTPIGNVTADPTILVRGALLVAGFIVIVVALHGLESNSETPIGVTVDGGQAAAS